MLKCPIYKQYICLKCRDSEKFRMISKSSACRKYYTDYEQLEECSKYVRVTNPHDHKGRYPLMMLFYDHKIQKHLYKIGDAGYMKYLVLHNYLIENGYEDALDYIRGN